MTSYTINTQCLYNVSYTEIWREIDDKGHYSVSNLGRIRNNGFKAKTKHGFRTVKSGFLKAVLQNNGYYTVDIHRKLLLVHRLVAKAFLPNPENKPEVNHKNGIKSDNEFFNLEWCTKIENERHSWETGLKKPYQNRQVINKVTGKIYPSMKEAEKIEGIGRLSRSLNGKVKNNTNFEFYDIKPATIIKN